MARIETRDRLNEAGEMCCKEEAMLNVVIRTLDTKEFRLQVGLLRTRALAAGARVCRGAYSTRASSCVEYALACSVCGRARVEKGGEWMNRPFSWQVRRDMSVEELKKEVANATSIAVESQRLMS